MHHVATISGHSAAGTHAGTTQFTAELDHQAAAADDSDGGIDASEGKRRMEGDLPSGTGTFTAGDTISGGYTFKSRFEDGPGSNPEQLIAAAHAACFSMALSNCSRRPGTPPESVHTDATVTLRPVDGDPTITKIELRHRRARPGHRRGHLRASRRRRPRPGARSVGPWPACPRSRSRRH